MSNLEVYDKLKTVPKEHLKTIKAGRLKGMSDIKPQWRIQRMTEIFWICWIGWRVWNVSFHYESYWDETVCNCRLDLYVKHEEKWSEWIPWTWGSRFSTKESKGMYVSDEAEKMSYTDALSVAMKMIGVASDIYMGLWNDSKYSNAQDWQGETKSKTDVLLENIQNAKDIEELLWYKDEIENTCVSEKQKTFFKNQANNKYKEFNK